MAGTAEISFNAEAYDREVKLQHARRVINSDLTLLNEALIANSRVPAKTNVVDDHVSRVVASLKVLLENIK